MAVYCDVQSSVFHCTALYCSAWCSVCIILYCIALYCSVCSVVYSTARHCIVVHSVVHCTTFVTKHGVFLYNFNCNRWRDCGCTRKHSPQERSSLSMKESLQTQIWLPGNPSQIMKSPQSLDTEHASPSWRPEAETVQFTDQWTTARLPHLMAWGRNRSVYRSVDNSTSLHRQRF